MLTLIIALITALAIKPPGPVEAKASSRLVAPPCAPPSWHSSMPKSGHGRVPYWGRSAPDGWASRVDYRGDPSCPDRGGVSRAAFRAALDRLRVHEPRRALARPPGRGRLARRPVPRRGGIAAADAARVHPSRRDLDPRERDRRRRHTRLCPLGARWRDLGSACRSRGPYSCASARSNRPGIARLRPANRPLAGSRARRLAAVFRLLQG